MTSMRLVFGMAAGSLLAMAAGGLEVTVLSSRPDTVSGGGALIEIRGPVENVRATLNGTDVTAAFRPGRTAGTLTGRVQGMNAGSNVLEVRAAGKRIRVNLMNHPITGPILSGPHQKPFVCETEAAGLGAALDENCSAKTIVQYFYKSSQPPPPAKPGHPPAPAFKPFDPAAPRPSDIAQTTTNEGKVVDYIVRREMGTINRAVYEIAMLHVPGQPLADPWTSGEGWNGRLVYAFGGGCSAGYHQGRSPSSLNDLFLSQGYASAASSLNVFGNNCDDVVSAETMMMVKEHFIEQFGAPLYTIGWGGSGGSMQQHLIAQNYPGLLDGILPAASYPDITTVIPTVVDCSLLARAFDSSGLEWTEAQKTAVSGYPTWNTCGSWLRSFSPKLVQSNACAPSVPKGSARCAIYDNQANLYGRNPADGAARRPLDNTGVQYGLKAFNDGIITADQFVALNEKVGGYDADGNLVDSRTAADPAALRVAYQKGRVVNGRALGSIPILDARVYLDPKGDIHDSFRSFVTRERIHAENGSSANHVIWTLPAGRPAPNGGTQADMLGLMDRWLAAIRNDSSEGAPAAKVIRNKPPELVDACWSEDGSRIAEPRVYNGKGRCEQIFPAFADPRIAAGGPLRGDILKCATAPVDAKSYRRPLSPEQISRLKAVFPQGVCDYSKPGIEQRGLQGNWLRY